MVSGLCAVLHLTETFVNVACSFADSFDEQIRCHEVGAGTCAEVTAVLNQFHAAQVDLTVTFDCVLNGVSGFCECRRIKDNHIELFTFLFQLRKKIEDISCDAFYAVGKAIQRCVLRRLCNT